MHATAPPTVTLGAGPSGDLLTAAPGTWTGDGPITYTYTWQSCDAAGAHCAPIHDADGDSYPVGDGDVGTTVRTVVTGDDGHGSVAVRSAASPLITAAAPASDHTPTIAGTAAVGALLTVDDSAWTGTGPVVVSYQWQRCASGGGDCVDIEDATSEDYTPGDSDPRSPTARGPGRERPAWHGVGDDGDHRRR